MTRPALEAPGRIDRRSGWTVPVPAAALDRPRPGPVLQIVSGQKPGAPGGPGESGAPDANANAFGLWRGFGHAWVRLIDTTGRRFSFGFYPDESAGIVPERQPGLCLPGVILHPDKYDRAATEQLATELPLTQAAFDALLEHLATLHRERRQHALPFSLTHHNCVHFAAQVAARVGVQVPASASLLALVADLGPAALRPAARWLQARAPAARRVVFNQALFALGGARVRPRQWLPSSAGGFEAVDVAGLEPLFARWSGVWHADWPIWHTHTLRTWQAWQAWQASQAGQAGPAPLPPEPQGAADPAVALR